MAQDLERSYWDSTPESPSARLCNFPTGSWRLLPTHKRWLSLNVVPILRRDGACVVEIGGLASRLGSSAFNERLGKARAKAVKEYLESELLISLPNVLTESYGERISGGAANDNDGYYRAALIKLHNDTLILPDPPPEVERPPKMPKVPMPKLYFGLGAKYGGIAAIGGTQSMQGYLFSADDYYDRAFVEARIWTLGPGLGGGANVVFIMAYGTPYKRKFVGTKFEGWDFAISLGGRWGDAIKGVKNIPAVTKLAKMVKHGDKIGDALKGLAKLSPGEWEKIAELVKTSRAALGVDPNSRKPEVSAFDIPLAGAALEVSLYKWWGKITSFN